MTLLWVVSSHDGLELAEDGAADVAFEVPADLAVCFARCPAAGEVVLGFGVEAHAGADDDVEGPVELAVARAVEPVSGGVAGGGRSWRNTSEGGEGCF